MLKGYIKISDVNGRKLYNSEARVFSEWYQKKKKVPFDKPEK
jgi:hypothetical protein